MSMVYINELKDFIGKEVTLKGWAANKREGKGIAFIVLRDGTGFCQCVASEEALNDNFNETKQINLETSLEVTGKVVADERQMGGVEIQATNVKVISVADEYPIAKKEHGVDFLSEKRHLWLRSSRQWAIMRVRNATIFAIHRFFQERNFVQMDAPIFTGNACEGTTDLFETEYFGRPAYLSQSGQLYGEAMAMAQGLIYTFGPTFRAEKSKTRRHLTEFWMIEPEMAFYDLDMDMDLIEEMLRFVVNEVVEQCKTELETLGRDVEPLLSVNTEFPRLTYTEAVQVLKGEKDIDGKNTITLLESDLAETKAKITSTLKEIEEREAIVNDNNRKKGERNFNRNKVGQLKNELKDLEEAEKNIPQWIESAKNFENGSDFGGSDETVLTRLFGCPIMVYNWPKAIKAFYMKTDPENPEFVKGVDVLAPEGYGEIVGGGERETNKEYLVEQIHKHELPMKEFEWYLDLRRFGSVPHSGFGLGLERLICWVCKLKHIREAIPFPRTSQRLMP